jgi:hypothetical protein
LVTGPHAPFLNIQPLAVTAGLGETAELHIDAVGSAPLSYQWQKINDLGEPISIPSGTNATLTITNLQNSDEGLYNCFLLNSAGTVTSSNALLTVIRVVTLPDAVDNTNATWSTAGAIGWQGQQLVNHDGSDAAQSGAIQNGKDSSLDATITGPGTLTFWWKVSSEPDYDSLSLYVDGDLVEFHSGEFDWTQKSLIIPNGAHHLRWTYAKDANLSQGEDAAWVDEVTFTPIANVAPEFIVAPGAQSVSLGGAAIFTAQYTADQPATFTWLKDGAPLTPRVGFLGVDTDTLTITNVQSTDAGVYSLRISNPSGSITSSGAVLAIVSMSIADALDQPQRAFLIGGDALWSPETSVTHDLADAVRSGTITDEQFTWIETRVAGPATLAFWWKVSSEADYDFLSLDLDTVSVFKISGQADWTHETLTLTPGLHTLRWKYQKDPSNPGGDDAGWLDQLEIIPPPPQPQITNLTLGADGVAATVQSLPASGSVVLESSADLSTWIPLSTNSISGSTLTVHRGATNNAEFLRVRLQ